MYFLQLHMIKRDGREVDFQEEKIALAVEKAMAETEAGIDHEVATAIAKTALEKFKDVPRVTIEEIQDMVEIELMKVRPEVAKKYIIYREERARLREHGWQMTDLQRDIYEKKYRFEGETFEEFIHRVSGGEDAIGKTIKPSPPSSEKKATSSTSPPTATKKAWTSTN